jgi:hypothetical protein
MDMAQQEQNDEDDEDQPDESTAPSKGVVTSAEAVAATQQGNEQDHDKDQYDRTHSSLLNEKKKPTG